MKSPTRRRRLLRLAAPLAAVALFVASPAPNEVAAAGCGENSGPLCKKNVSCAWFLFYKQCTETYDYYLALK